MQLEVIEELREFNGIPALIDQAASELMSARSAAEVLDAHDKADLAYDLAKKVARIEKARDAHDTVISAAHRVQARALEIQSQAKIRLADEYDAARKNGEVAGPGQYQREGANIPDENVCPPRAQDVGLTLKQIHEARLFRNAERNDPGVVSRTINEALDGGDEPTKARVRESIVKAATDALSGRGPRVDRRNPNHDPDPEFDAVAGLNGACRRINELFATHGHVSILDGCVSPGMRNRSLAIIEECRDNLSRILEAKDA